MITSYNGWPASPSRSMIGVVPFAAAGASFPGGVKGGDVEVVFRYLVEQLAKRVERPHVGWCWGHNYRANVNDTSTLSCHSSGTALDYNAPRHPNGKAGTFTAEQVVEVRAILRELGGVIRWGGDFSRTKDEMHFEVAGSTAEVAAVAKQLRGGPIKVVVAKVKVVVAKAKPRPRLPILRVGSRGAEVRSLQHALHIAADGVYGPATAEAVRAFQRRYWPHDKTMWDGSVGPKTWKALGH